LRNLFTHRPATQPCVLIHELTHLTNPTIAYTDDQSATEEDARQLALDDPVEAVQCAWNLELYIQNEF
jgi:hypothetical protein